MPWKANPRYALPRMPWSLLADPRAVAARTSNGWKGIPPHVVFDVLVPGNRDEEMDRKFAFYQRYGVEEYYIYDPDTAEFFAYVRSGDVLEPINQVHGWVSPRLGTRFDLSGPELVIYRPDGRAFRTLFEMEDERAQATLAARQAQQQGREDRQRIAALQQQTERERGLRDEAQQRAEQERVQREQEQHAKEAAESRAERLAARLRELGIDPEAD